MHREKLHVVRSLGDIICMCASFRCLTLVIVISSDARPCHF